MGKLQTRKICSWNSSGKCFSHRTVTKKKVLANDPGNQVSDRSPGIMTFTQFFSKWICQWGRIGLSTASWRKKNVIPKESIFNCLSLWGVSGVLLEKGHLTDFTQNFREYWSIVTLNERRLGDDVFFCCCCCAVTLSRNYHFHLLLWPTYWFARLRLQSVPNLLHKPMMIFRILHFL